MAESVTHEKPARQKPELTWSPFTAVIVVLVIYLVSAVIGNYALNVYPLVEHWSPSVTNAWLHTTTAQFLYILAVESLTVGGLIAFVRLRKGSFRSLGLVRPRLKDPLIAVPALFIYMGGYLVLLSVLTRIFPSINVNQPQDLGFSANQHGTDLAMTFISLVILPPLVEETVMRGFLFTSLRQKLHVGVAALITSALFAAAHLEWGSNAPLLWVAAIDTFSLSLVLCYLRYKTGSLWAGITLHALKNVIAFVSLFVLHLS